MTQLVKPTLDFDAEKKLVTVKLDIDYRNEVAIDIDLLFDVIYNADKLVLNITDPSGVHKLAIDLSGTVVAKDDNELIIYGSNQSCLLVGRDGTVIATPYCKSPFQGGGSS